jgi:hypothetical protein
LSSRSGPVHAPVSDTQEETYAAAWEAAAPYLHVRKNDVHVPLSFAFAERLLEEHPDADRDVVLLAELLHDVGWALVDHGAAARGTMLAPDLQVAHEKEGAELAGRLLDELGYDAALRDEVVAIIDGHDTRTHSISLNDALVKDADKLWRATVAGLGIGCDWFSMTPAEYALRVDRDVEALFTEPARAIGRTTLVESRRLLRLAQLGPHA